MIDIFTNKQKNRRSHAHNGSLGKCYTCCITSARSKLGHLIRSFYQSGVPNTLPFIFWRSARQITIAASTRKTKKNISLQMTKSC